MEEQIAFIKKWAHKILPIALTLQGLYGIYSSVVFIFIDYPLLTKQLQLHLITQSQVNDFAVKAIMIFISTFLTFIFAMKLGIMKSKVAHWLQTGIGISLVIFNALIHDYFVSLNASQKIVDLILWLIRAIKSFP